MRELCYNYARILVELCHYLMEVFEVTEHTPTGSRSVQDTSSDSRSSQYPSSDK